MRKLLTTFIVLAIFSWSEAAYANSHVARFVYSPVRIYRVYAKNNFLTDIQFRSKIQTVATGAAKFQWLTQTAGNNLFLKPLVRSTETSMTVITQRHTYQFFLLSSPSRFEQLITFRDPEEQLIKQEIILKKKLHQKNIQFDIPKSRLMNTKNINFDYVVSGSKSLRPIEVFTFKGFTYLLMPNHLQSLPALFVVRHNGRLALVNYKVSGRYIIIERTFAKAALKLGHKEVFIYKKINSGW